MEDINKLLNEAKAAAARQAAIEREKELIAAREAMDEEPPETDEAEAPEGMGELIVERRQGKWRCYLCGERIRSGDPLDVYVNERVGWVRGRLQWARSPHTPPSVRVAVTHPSAIDDEGEPASLGEMELLLPEDAVCRWPQDG